MRYFTAAAQLQAMLDVEVALAHALVEAGVIPPRAAEGIASAGRAERFDHAALAADAAAAGNIAIPFVRALTALVQDIDAESARHVHRGATSQDVIDTAFVLQLRALGRPLHEALSRAMAAAAARAREHASTPMPGRTWLQHATPVTFGLKAAGWLDALGRCRARLDEAIAGAGVLQFGGASGTLASLGDAGPRVAAALARRLSLDVPDMPWHTHRDRLAAVAAACGIACGTLGKIGRDLALLAQSEVREVFEGEAPGRGSSSSMPHKRNPVAAVELTAASLRAPGLVSTMMSAMTQEHERAAGGWQAEWETLPVLCELTLRSAEVAAVALGEIQIDMGRMQENLRLRGGVAMAEALSSALSEHVPRGEAAAHVERLCRQVEASSSRPCWRRRSTTPRFRNCSNEPSSNDSSIRICSLDRPTSLSTGCCNVGA